MVVHPLARMIVRLCESIVTGLQKRKVAEKEKV